MKAKYFVLRCVCLLLLALYGGVAWAYEEPAWAYYEEPDFHVDGIAYNVLSEENRTVEVTFNRLGQYGSIDNSDYVSGAIVIPQRIIYSGKTYTVVAIGDFAFNRCRSLTSVLIPNSVTSIGNGVFLQCSISENVLVDDANPRYTSVDGVLYTINKDTLIVCPRAKATVEIPNSVTTIESSAFSGCSSLTSVELPNATTIGDEAFFRCDALTCVELPNVTTIGDNAFYDCSSLTSVELPNVTMIGVQAFFDCSSLTSVELPNVTTIGGLAFSGCDGLTSVELPNATTIGDNAFSGCDGLTSVELPNATMIGYSAFYDCSSLTSVEIGSSVTTIGGLAFYGSDSIRTIYCRMPEPIECNPRFSDDVLMYATLYVPTGTKAAYEQVDPWRNFWNIEEMDFENATAIENVTADGTEASVTTENGAIVLKGDSRLPVEVYSVGGQCLYRGTDRRIAGLPNGVYVVKIGNRSQKIVL